MCDLRSLVLSCASVLLLTSCSGTSGAFSPTGSNSNGPLHVARGSQTFGYTGSEQTFGVPSGVKRVTITADGASGAQCTSSCEGYGTPGNGGYVKATIPVTPGEKLVIFVGGDNGYNGGAPGTSSGFLNGGGASDVREGGETLADRVVVAGGGGSGGLIYYWPSLGDGGNGGAGGGRGGTAGGGGSGEDTGGGGGYPGNQRAGGQGGPGGQYYGRDVKRLCSSCGHCNGATGADGTLGLGGDGATTCGGPGGGGGGGYYGGGGGGSGAGSYYRVSIESGGGGGGGGGSSFVERRAFEIKQKKGGAAPGNGKIRISW